MTHEQESSQHVPKLSIAVLNYNYGRYIGACIETILAQSFTDFELIVIDDCSTDDSLDLIRPYLTDSRIRLIEHKKNKGFVESLIEGAEILPRGTYAAVMSADDLILDRDAFKKQVELLESDLEIALCFSSHERIDSETGRVIDLHKPFPHDKVFSSVEFLDMFLSSIDIQVLHSGAMVRMSAFRASGGYRRDMRYCVDTALWMTLPLFGRVGFIAQALYGYRIHTSQMSGSLVSVLPTMRETRAAIDSVYRISQRRSLDLGVSRAQALRVYLPAMAVSDAFGDRYRVGLARLVAGVRTDPVHTVLSARFWIAVARMGLGKNAFQATRLAWRNLRNREASGGDLG